MPQSTTSTARPLKAVTRSEFLRHCYASPSFFAKNCCGLTATPQQKQVFDAMAKPGAKVAISSGHGVGKSSALAVLALWFLVTRDGAKIPCTAPTAHQLEDILWGEIRRLVSRFPEWLKAQVHVSKNRVTIDNSDGFIVARTARPEQPEALQGFHGDNLLFIIDEGAGVDDKIFEVAYGALSTPNARAIMPGNPTLLSGFFYRTFHTENSWSRFQFSAIDSPLVDTAFVEVVKRDYGEDSDAYRVRVLGQFPRMGLAGIIPAAWVDAAFARRLPGNHLFMHHAVLGVDPAWEGEDRSAIALRRGNYAKILMAERHLSGEALARRVATFAAMYDAQYIFVDKTGVGASCCDFLSALRIKHIRVSFAESPFDTNFLNKRAEMWWKLREWFQKDETVMEPFEGLRDDLIAPTYGIRDNGKIYLESKEEMRKKGTKSPDLADALALCHSLPDELAAIVRTSHHGDRKTWSESWDDRQRQFATGDRRVC